MSDRARHEPDDELDALIAALPEVYQPIYGHGSYAASRDADLPRTAHVRRMVDVIASERDRPLRILDLGSAQGYFCFLLAERGHQVVGLEYLAQNIAVSRALADRNPALAVEFVHDDLNAVAELVSQSPFDLVLGLSVLHHMVHRDGLEATTSLIAALAAAVPFAMFEMARREEPVYWGPSQPADPRVTIASYPFIRQLGRSRTHLSHVARPLLFCSTSHAWVGGTLTPIRSYSEFSHPGAAPVLAGKRRYFHLDGSMVKISAQFDEVVDHALLDDLKQELRSERLVLDRLRAEGFDVPAVLEFVDEDGEVLLARTTQPGTLVSELLGSDDLDREEVIRQVAQDLARLESVGLFHRDLRTWNVLWDPESRRARLIDFGSIAGEPDDVTWPRDARFSFLLFLVAVTTGTPEELGIDVPRSVLPDPDAIPPRLLSLLARSWSLPARGHFFGCVAEFLDDPTELDPGDAPLVARWLHVIGSELEDTARRLGSQITDVTDEVITLRRDAQELRVELANRQADNETLVGQVLEAREHTAEVGLERDQYYDAYIATHKQVGYAHAELARLEAEIERLDAALEAARAEHDAERTRANGLERELTATLASSTWRLSAPARRALDLVRRRR